MSWRYYQDKRGQLAPEIDNETNDEVVDLNGAGDGIRTHDPNLGKVSRVKQNQRLSKTKPVK